MSHRRIRATFLVAGLCIQSVAIAAAGTVVTAPPRTPPPTPVNGTPSPFPSELRTPADGTIEPKIGAPTALLADLASGDVLFAKGARVPRPVASVTKLMTALVVLSRAVPSDRVVVSRGAVFDRAEYGASSVLGLRVGERLSVRDLLYGSLLGSANDASRALAIHVAGSEAGFVELMNERARALGMRHTSFASATGLDDRGRSTAADLLIMARTAFEDPTLAEIVGARFHSIPGPRGRQRRIQNRNALLWLYPAATGGKTGSTAAAGYCLIATAEREGRRLVTIVLGAPGEAFSDAAALLDYGFEGFRERTLVAAGQALGLVRIRGGSVPVVAGAGLEGLVAGDPGLIRYRFDVATHATYPPTTGEVVGTYRAISEGLEIGSVPLVVAEVPGPTDPGEEPWWIRAAAAVADALGSAVGGLF